LLLKLLLPFCGESERDGRDVGARFVLPPQILICRSADFSRNPARGLEQEIWNHELNIRFVNLSLPPSKMQDLVLLRLEIRRA
jgi:hypothetical protein